MFLFKKILSPLFLPVCLSLIVLLLGFISLHFRRGQRRGRFLVFIGILLIFCFSSEFVSDRLIYSLEQRYPPLAAERLAGEKSRIKWIAVLGGGHTDDPGMPAIGRLNGASLARLVEGVRLHRELPSCKLILAGGAVFDKATESGTMANAAMTLGIAEKNIVQESLSRDTEEQALLIGKIVGPDLFILVTSASHMPRAMALFRKAGLDPIPSPTQFQGVHSGGLQPNYFFPRADELEKSETAVYEYLGMVWEKIRGKI